MADTARVESVDAIKDFRIYLTKYGEAAGSAIGDADSEITRMERWLDGEGANYWAGVIRKRQELLAKAEEALRFKRLYKDSSGGTPSAVEEQKQVQICKRNLAEAMEKQQNVKRSARELQKEVTIYRGNMGRFIGAVSALPAAVAHLGSTLDHLDKYLEVAPAGAGEEALAGAGVGSGAREDTGASMARAAEEAPKAQAGPEVDAHAIRAGIPSDQAIFAAKPAEAGPLMLACGLVTAEQNAAIAPFAKSNPPGDAERIVILPSIYGSSRIYLVKLKTAGVSWCVGSVDGLDTGVYNTVTTGDLRAGRGDLAQVLKLPAGSLAIIDAVGLTAVYNEQNENILQPAAAAEPAGAEST